MGRVGRKVMQGPGRIALLPPAAFAVHQLRYEIVYGSQAGRELTATGHSYLHSVVPWLVALIGISAGCFLRRVGQALGGRRSARASTASFATSWAICVATLLLIFFCQENLEGLFASGHPGGWAAAFGDGGWWAIPVAAGIGLILAVLFRGARWIAAAVARARRGGLAPRPADGGPAFSVISGPAVTVAPWLRGWSSRGPPAYAGASVSRHLS